jgi:NAD(P)-dependent dehydrogenase (short-subunit alcohol dehydrogenase family)
VDVTEKTFGKVNVIFNNAGIMHSDDDNAMKTEEDVWDMTLDVNMKVLSDIYVYIHFMYIYIRVYWCMALFHSLLKAVYTL